MCNVQKPSAIKLCTQLSASSEKLGTLHKSYREKLQCGDMIIYSFKEQFIEILMHCSNHKNLEDFKKMLVVNRDDIFYLSKSVDR